MPGGGLGDSEIQGSMAVGEALSVFFWWFLIFFKRVFLVVFNGF